MIRSRFFVVAAAVFLFAAANAIAQNPALDKQLSRIDLGISGVGEFTKAVSGPVVSTGGPNVGAVVSVDASNTLGALVDLRYIAKPYVGFEFNYGYARYTENFSTAPFGVQTNVNEYTLGYVATPKRTVFGFQPFASAGAGSLQFKPTPRGGQQLPIKARAVYYYSVGLQQDVFSSHFGLRAGFRQLFYLAPDFGQNYLTIKKRTITSEPSVGFYLRF